MGVITNPPSKPIEASFTSGNGNNPPYQAFVGGGTKNPEQPYRMNGNGDDETDCDNKNIQEVVFSGGDGQGETPCATKNESGAMSFEVAVVFLVIAIFRMWR